MTEEIASRIDEAQSAWRKAHSETAHAEELLRDARERESLLFADFAELVNPRYGRHWRRMIEYMDRVESGEPVDEEMVETDRA